MPKKQYEIKVNLGRRIDGTMVRHSIYSTKSKADAKRKAEKYKMEYEIKRTFEDAPVENSMNFSVWARSCLDTYKKPFVKGNIYSGTYMVPLEKHLIPCFGNMKLAEIQPFHIQKYINDNVNKYAPETIKKDYNVLNFIFQTAVDNNLCEKNPIVRSIRLPQYQTMAQKHAFTEAEYDTVYEFAKTHPNGLSIMILLETGLSRSELLGLTWHDFDKSRNLLHVKEGLVMSYSDTEQRWVTEHSNLKNRHRKRDIPIVCKALQERLYVLSAEHIERDQPVIHSPQGKPFQPNNWMNRVYKPFFQELQEAHLEVPFRSPHELRHTRATLWIAQGVAPYMVARLLGHTDLKMLTKIYDHTTADTLRKALERAQCD